VGIDVEDGRGVVTGAGGEDAAGVVDPRANVSFMLSFEAVEETVEVVAVFDIKGKVSPLLPEPSAAGVGAGAAVVDNGVDAAVGDAILLD
jgi:hypothetical protein